MNTDSGTGDVAGLASINQMLTSELQEMGAEVKRVAPRAPALGDNLIATLRGKGRGRILLIAHMDTVFAHGTAAQRPYRLTADQAIGPGAGDDKAGIVTAVCALRVLRGLGYHDFGRITLLLNSNEETGSVGTRDLIQSLATESEAVFNLERGAPPDAVVVARKGSAIITLEVTGRAAHSGLEPDKGRNAILEASHQARRLGSLANAAKATTVNVTLIEGGSAVNVIPDRAVVKADVRAFTSEEFDRVEAALQKLSAETQIPDIQVKAYMVCNFPSWPRAPAADVLLARAQRLYAEIDGQLTAVSVGSSADVAFAAQGGTPSLDGLAMRRRSRSGGVRRPLEAGAAGVSAYPSGDGHRPRSCFEVARGRQACSAAGQHCPLVRERGTARTAAGGAPARCLRVHTSELSRRGLHPVTAAG